MVLSIGMKVTLDKWDTDSVPGSGRWLLVKVARVSEPDRITFVRVRYYESEVLCEHEARRPSRYSYDWRLTCLNTKKETN
jgi:hypothetical protein